MSVKYAFILTLINFIKSSIALFNLLIANILKNLNNSSLKFLHLEKSNVFIYLLSQLKIIVIVSNV